VAGESHVCWPKAKPPGAVTNVHHGIWKGADFSLEEGSVSNPDGNHAKIGISAAGGHRLVIFGDENQAGYLDPKAGDTCAHSQFSRGGLFFVIDSAQLWGDLDTLFETGPKMAAPPKATKSKAKAPGA
jgi:hypothetical protein